MNHQVDRYLVEGCGRCPLGNTPECKVNNWKEELKELREIVLDCALNEELKWGVPCYTFDNNNIILISAFKSNCVISFFKGSLLKDNKRILTKPGENTQTVRVIRFKNLQEVKTMKDIIKEYIKEAIEVEKEGLKANNKEISEFFISEELQNKLDTDEAFKNAFENLTVGRRKGYLLYFDQPKQSKTRIARIDKCKARILLGKGLNSVYNRKDIY